MNIISFLVSISLSVGSKIQKNKTENNKALDKKDDVIDISNSSSMLVDWNKGVSCVGQSVQDVEVENVENDDGIEADNNQDYKWRGDDNEQVKCFVIVCLSAMLYFGKYHSFRRKCATQLTNKPFFR